MQNAKHWAAGGWSVALALGLIASLGACSSEYDGSGSEDVPGLEQWTLVEAGSEEAAPSTEGAPAEDEGEPGEGTLEKAGCVHIQWCNEPGSVGTVCIWDACSLAAAVDECTRDANAVCGRIVQPAEIR